MTLPFVYGFVAKDISLTITLPETAVLPCPCDKSRINQVLGISDEEKEKIFKRFYRSEKSRNDKEHFGLGLSIAYEIVKLHKGNIKITDTPGGGSNFTINLPSNL